MKAKAESCKSCGTPQTKTGGVKPVVVGLETYSQDLHRLVRSGQLGKTVAKILRTIIGVQIKGDQGHHKKNGVDITKLPVLTGRIVAMCRRQLSGGIMIDEVSYQILAFENPDLAMPRYLGVHKTLRADFRIRSL